MQKHRGGSEHYSLGYDELRGLATDHIRRAAASGAPLKIARDEAMRRGDEEGIYIYNMDLKSLDNGTYKVFVRLGDSETCSAGNPSVIVTVAKKGKK